MTDSAIAYACSPQLQENFSKASAALEASKFKEAIDQFKALLKTQRHPSWLQGLAQAYAGRTEQLMAKDMFKEALALWRTRSEICGVPLMQGPYTSLLLRCGQIHQALAQLAQLDTLPVQAQAALQTQLTSVVLTASDAQLALIPPDHPLGIHGKAAKAALQAYGAGLADALETALQAISFHSPYRELRLLLKALVLCPTEPQAAAAILTKVPPCGPFENLRQVLDVALMPSPQWLVGLEGLSEVQRIFVLDMKGCPVIQRVLIFELMKLALQPRANTDELSNVLLRRAQCLPQDVSQQLCLGLAPHAPHRFNAFIRSSSQAHQHHIRALAADLKESEQAEVHWQDLAEVLAQTPGQAQRAAMVWRHLAQSHSHHGDEGGELCTHAQDWFKRSLNLHPNDAATHLRLVRCARSRGDLRQARQLLDTAMALLPMDTSLLQEAWDMALASGAFKKAIDLAQKILQHDPLNTQVRLGIGHAHMAAARKQIASRKFELANREIESAQPWLTDALEQAPLNVLRGLATESDGQRDEFFQKAFSAWSNPWRAAFHVLLEHRRIKLPLTLDGVRKLGVKLPAAPSALQVLDMVQALDAAAQIDQHMLDTLTQLQGALEVAAASLDFELGDHLKVCESLHRAKHPKLLQHFAHAGHTRWPESFMHIYFEAAARFEHKPWTLPEKEWQRLSSVVDRAKAQGDQLTTVRLSNLLNASDRPAPSRGRKGSFQNLFGGLGQNPLLDIVRSQMSDEEFELLRKKFKGTDEEFTQALLELMLTGNKKFNI
jgi:cellulose synthase operon protein C